MNQIWGLKHNGWYFANSNFKYIFMDEHAWILIKISRKCIPGHVIGINWGFVQVVVWWYVGTKPLPKPDMTMPCGVIRPHCVNSLRPRQMDAIFQTILSNAFSWMKMLEFRLKFHWSLFLRAQLRIVHHCFRWWLGADQATNHYLKQWWLESWRIYASLGLDELTHFMMSPQYPVRSRLMLSPLVCFSAYCQIIIWYNAN